MTQKKKPAPRPDKPRRKYEPPVVRSCRFAERHALACPKTFDDIGTIEDCTASFYS